MSPLLAQGIYDSMGEIDWSSGIDTYIHCIQAGSYCLVNLFPFLFVFLGLFVMFVQNFYRCAFVLSRILIAICILRSLIMVSIAI